MNEKDNEHESDHQNHKLNKIHREWLSPVSACMDKAATEHAWQRSSVWVGGGSARGVAALRASPCASAMCAARQARAVLRAARARAIARTIVTMLYSWSALIRPFSNERCL